MGLEEASEWGAVTQTKPSWSNKRENREHAGIILMMKEGTCYRQRFTKG